MKPRNVMSVQKGGRTFHYFRMKGADLIALPDLPFDAPEFLSAYATAKATAQAQAATARPARRIAAKGSLDEIATLALGGDYFRSLSPGYKAMIRRELGLIRARDDRVGALPIAQAQPQHIRADLISAPNPADRLKAWRFLFATAMEAGRIDVDASQLVKVPRDRRRKPRGLGHRRVMPAHNAQWRDRYAIGTVARAGLELLCFTGARREDATRLGPQHVNSRRPGVLTYLQGKTKGPAHVPWTCTLPPYAAHLAGERAMMLDAIAALDRRQLTFLATAQGRTRSAKAFGTLIRAALSDIGIDRSAHGFRKHRACDLLEHGATPHEAAAWTGHEDLDELNDYAREMQRVGMVDGSSDPDQDRKFANHGQIQMQTNGKT